VTSDLRELYQNVILDHHKKPRNFGKLADANREAEGYNPLCGDQFTFYLKLAEDVVQDVRFVGTGCAISTASASMMTERLKGKTRAEAEALFQQFHDLLTCPRELDKTGEDSSLGKLEAFAGVREFPVRVKCATLPWHTFLAALRGEAKPVSTE
jgi:nitrogen fixation protein NifU and related proteins